jgi:predicted SprT family Zn-dependent metalloprotease
MFIRTIKYKGGQEVMKLFEQIRKNINLNKKNMRSDDKANLHKTIRKEFYDGLISDLMQNKSYELSEIVMAEKLKEKFSETVNDELIGLNIYAAQGKFQDYRSKFELLIGDESPYKFDEKISQELGKTLMKFDTDELKNDRLMLTEKIVRKMRDNEIVYDSSLFQNVAYVYTESQQWNDVA